MILIFCPNYPFKQLLWKIKMQNLQKQFPFLSKSFSTGLTNYLEGTIHGRRIIISTQSTNETYQWILTDNNKYIVVSADVLTKIPVEVTAALTKILNNETVEPNQGAKILASLLG